MYSPRRLLSALARVRLGDVDRHGRGFAAAVRRRNQQRDDWITFAPLDELSDVTVDGHLSTVGRTTRVETPHSITTYDEPRRLCFNRRS